VLKGDDPGDWTVAQSGQLTAALHDLAGEMGGSFSAEHGVGRLKRAERQLYVDAGKRRLQRIVKEAVDPQGLMNRGAVFDRDD
jgi:FAD/FMN-containing dehydrogenase